MWPQPIFISPSGVRVEIVCRLKGRAQRNTTTNLTTVPTPSCAMEGDWQIIVGFLSTNTSYSWTGIDWGTGDNQWQQLEYMQGFRPHVLARRIGAAPPADFAIPVSGGYLDFSYITFILRNVLDPRDPVPAAATGNIGYTWSMTDFPTTRGAVRPPQSIALQTPKDLILGVESQGGSRPSTGLIGPPEGGPILFADTQIDVGLGRPNNFGVTIHRNLEYEDMLGGEQPLSGWTNVNMTPAGVSAAQEVGYREAAVSNARFGFYRDFNLVAGETYEFSMSIPHAVSPGTGTGSSSLYFGFVDPDGVEHGVASSTGGNTTAYIGSLVTEANHGQRVYINNGSGQSGHQRYLRIKPVQTGVHRVWWSELTQAQTVAGLPALADRTGSTGRGIQVSAVSFVKLPSSVDSQFIGEGGADTRNNPARLDPVNKSVCIANRVNIQEVSRGGTYLVIRGAAGKRKLAKFQVSSPMWLAFGADGLSQSMNNDHGFLLGGSYTNCLYTDHIVYPKVGTRFYFEMNVTTANSLMTIGWVSHGQDEEYNTGSILASGYSEHYFYRGSGAIYQGATLVTTGAAISNGDVVGCELDYGTSTVKFYLNGVLQGSRAITDNHRNNAFKAFTLHSMNGYENTSVRYAINLVGPFAHKPIGCVAFDFDNEVGAQLVGTEDFNLLAIRDTNPQTIPYPSFIQPGDLVFVHLHATTSIVSGVIGGWPSQATFFSRGGSGTGFTDSYYAACYIAGTETEIPFTFNTVSAKDFHGNFTVLRGANLSTPLGNISPWYYGANMKSAWISNTTSGTVPDYDALLVNKERRGGDKSIVVKLMYHNDAVAAVDYEADHQLVNVIDGQAQGGAFIHHVKGPDIVDKSRLGVLIPPVAPASVTRTNLLQYSDALDQWTFNNIASMTVDVNYPTGTPYPVFIMNPQTDPTNPWVPYLSQVVNLEAGKRYTLLLGLFYPQSAFETFLGVDDGTNGWRIVTFDTNGPVGQVNATSDMLCLDFHEVLTPAISFVALQDGAHTITMGMCDAPYAPIERPAGLSMSGSNRIGHPILVEGFMPHTFQPEFYSDTTTLPTMPNMSEASLFITKPGVTTNARIDAFEAEVIDSAQAPPPVKLVVGQMKERVTLSADRLSSVNAHPKASSSQLWLSGVNTMIPPSGFGASPGKYYFEITVVSLEHDGWCVGIGEASPDVGALDSNWDSNYAFDKAGLWTYHANYSTTAGKVSYDAVTTTGLATSLTPGDVVGVAVDRVNHTVQFFKNGTAIHTAGDISGRDREWLSIWLGYNRSSLSSYPVQQLTANFAGPFSYPVSGFSPLQWW